MNKGHATIWLVSWEAYNRGPLKSGCSSVENKHRLDPIEEKLADSPEKAEDVGIVEAAPVLITHGGLKLIEPDARIDRKGLALHRFKTDAPRARKRKLISARWQSALPG